MADGEECAFLYPGFHVALVKIYDMIEYEWCIGSVLCLMVLNLCKEDFENDRKSFLEIKVATQVGRWKEGRMISAKPGGAFHYIDLFACILLRGRLIESKFRQLGRPEVLSWSTIAKVRIWMRRRIYFKLRCWFVFLSVC